MLNLKSGDLNSPEGLRALIFFIGYDFHNASPFGGLRNGSRLMEALFDHLMVDSLAALLRLTVRKVEVYLIGLITTIVCTRSLVDVRAASRAAEICGARREPVILPNHYLANAQAGAMPNDWPGADKFPQALLDSLGNWPFALVFCHGAMGLSNERIGEGPPFCSVEDFCDGLGVTYPNDRESHGLPTALLLPLGDNHPAQHLDVPITVPFGAGLPWEVNGE